MFAIYLYHLCKPKHQRLKRNINGTVPVSFGYFKSDPLQKLVVNNKTSAHLFKINSFFCQYICITVIAKCQYLVKFLCRLKNLAKHLAWGNIIKLHRLLFSKSHLLYNCSIFSSTSKNKRKRKSQVGFEPVTSWLEVLCANNCSTEDDDK